MNCPQCQTANGPDSAFCGNCGARLAPAGTPGGAGGYTSSSATPLGYNASDGAAGSAGYDASGGYGAPAGYGAPGGGYNAPPSPGYGPASGQAPTSYPQQQYGEGQHPQAQHPQAQHPQGQYPQGQYPQGAPGPHTQRSPGLPPASFDPNRLTTIDKIVAGATLITMISIWLPWYAVSFGAGDSAFGEAGSVSFSGTWGHGWLWLEFVVALVLIAYLAARAAWGRLPFNLPVAHAPLLIVGTALQLLLILIAFVDIPYGNDGMGWSWAAFIGLIAALAAAGPVVYPAVKSYLDSRNAASGTRGY